VLIIVPRAVLFNVHAEPHARTRFGKREHRERELDGEQQQPAGAAEPKAGGAECRIAAHEHQRYADAPHRVRWLRACDWRQSNGSPSAALTAPQRTPAAS
jgi:hypothetical protein